MDGNERRSRSNPDEQRVRQIVSLLLDGDDENVSSILDRLRKARDLLHHEIASQAEAALNSELQSQHQETLSQKQKLARWLNSQMRELGIAVKCPKTEMPAFLRADPNGDSGRFQLRLLTTQGDHRRSLSFGKLVDLRFMAYYERREQLAEYWSERASRPRGETGKHC